jgi:hypothetical protein
VSTNLDMNALADCKDAYFSVPNDSLTVLTQYKEKRKLKSVLALCFVQTDERYHHWSADRCEWRVH